MFSYQTMRPYHPANLASHSYSAWKLITLAWVAKLLGVHIKVDGIPYGAECKTDFYGENCDGTAAP